MFGFGGTACPDPETTEYSQDARTKHLLGFLDALGLDQPRLASSATPWEEERRSASPCLPPNACAISS